MMNDHVVQERAALSMLIVFECFTVPIFLLFLYAGLMGHEGWEGAIIAAILCLLVFVWWRSFLLEITGDTLIYRSLFLSRKEIKLCDIHRVKRTIDLVSHGFRPPNRLEIHAIDRGKNIEFDINMKVFTLAGGKKIESILKPSHS